MVVRLLLANPRLTEADVLRIAARRPGEAAVLSEVARAAVRFGRVRLAVVLNPATPRAVSVPLLALLSRPELREVTQAMDVPPEVRTLALEIAALRPPPESRQAEPSALEEAPDSEPSRPDGK